MILVMYAGHGSSTDGLSRFFFVLGQIAIQLLVHIEQIASATRRQRLAKEKAAAESDPGEKGKCR